MRGMWFLALVGCGRLGFNGATPADGAVDGAADSAPDAPEVRHNRVFVTSGTFMGALGGLAGADQQCMLAAQAAGLPGTFVAWLSTTTTDAAARLAGSRGWVRTDGVPVMDTIEAVFTAGQMYAPIDRDETGARIPYTTPTAWTNTDVNGRSLGNNGCTDWTVTTGTGFIGDAASGTPSFSYMGTATSCNQQAHLLCFELGYQAAVTLPATTPTGRIAFVSKPRVAGGLAALDALCNQDATSAGLPGTYRAAVATTTTTIASRFTIDARPIQRVDGALVANDGAGLLGSSLALTSFVGQHADGSYTTDYLMYTGAVDATTVGTTPSTCSDWSDTTGMTGVAVIGVPAAADRRVWYLGMTVCLNTLPVLCVEQ